MNARTPAWAGIAVLVASSPVFAQTSFPEKMIRVVVGFPAGSGVDIITRVFSQRLGETLGKPVIVENVAGAAGSIAAERVARAVPDGYTLALASQGQVVINPMLYKLAFDPVKDLAPISQVYLSSNVLVVNSSATAHSVQDLIALARARPGELTFATGGSGSSPHLAGTLFKSMAGIDIREIPYKGVNAAIPDLLSDRVNMMFSPIAEVLSLVRERKLRALAVSSFKRSSALPDVPTVDESGVRGFDATSWGGLLAPTGIPTSVVGKLHAATATVVAESDIRARLLDVGVTASGNSPHEFAVLMKSEVQRWSKVFAEAGIKAGQ
jgi:tripartite-type tricarboxylate transporter receptor subunit TctC